MLGRPRSRYWRVTFMAREINGKPVEDATPYRCCCRRAQLWAGEGAGEHHLSIGPNKNTVATTTVDELRLSKHRALEVVAVAKGDRDILHSEIRHVILHEIEVLVWTCP